MEAGEKPWIAEMYGYVFGAAKANVWHNPVDYFQWIYPGYFTSGEGGTPNSRSRPPACILNRSVAS